MPQETVTLDEYKKLIQQQDKPKASKPKKQPDLVRRVCSLLAPYGWTADLYRAFCLDERSPENTAETTAKDNAIVAWRTGNEPYTPRVLFVGWIWDVEQWADEQIIECVKLIEQEGAA